MSRFVKNFAACAAAATMLLGASLLSSQPARAQFKQQGNKLVGTGANGPAQQGSVVALSSDGNTALIGAPFDHWGGNASSDGAAWVFTRSNGAWNQQGSKLVGIGMTNSGAFQGTGVALSADGNTALVGAPEDGHGSARVFIRSNGVWKQQGSKLVGTGAAAGGANQGAAVALSADGNTALIGGPEDNHSAGAVWVFTRSNGVWKQQGHKLVGTGAVGVNSSLGSHQGASVALSADGNTAIVGGPTDHDSQWYIGATWVFTRSNGVWSQQGNKLIGGLRRNGDVFQGQSVGLSADGNTAIVGGYYDNIGTGGAWFFVRQNGAWTEQDQKLIDTGGPLGSDQRVPVALSADGNTAIVGGSYANSGAGTAWVFARSKGAWSRRGPILMGTGAVGNAMQGTAVALSGDANTALIGGPNDDSKLGATWVFVAVPAVTGVSPTTGSARGGTNVTITGTNLTGATAVKFGTIEAASFTVRNATTIVARTPAHPKGKVLITVTTPAGSGYKAGGFTFN